MDDNNKSEHVSVRFYQRIETSQRVNESGHATEDLDMLDQTSDSTANTCQQMIASQIDLHQTSDSPANTCQETIASRIDFGVEHTQLGKCLIDETQAEDSVNKSHVKVFEYNINNISETKISTENENHKENTSESNDATNMENQSNDNELCQQTVTYVKSEMEDNIEKIKFQTVNCIENEKSQMEDNIEIEKNQIVNNTETEKSQMEDSVETQKSQMQDNIETEKSLIEDNIYTECSKLEYHMDMQRPPSHITVANWSRKNTPTKKTKSSDSVISEEVNALSRQDSKKKLVNNSDIDNITEKVTGIGNTKLCMNNESTTDSLNTKDENEYRLATNNDEGIKSKKGDRLSEGVPDDNTDSNALNTSSQSIKHEETVRSCMDCIKPVQVKTWKEINIGDHIILSRSFYDHHAIVIRVIEPKDDTSDQVDLELIHQTNSTMGAFWDKIRPLGSLAKLQRKTETVDLKRDIVMICKYWGSIKPSSPEEVVKRAIGALQAGPVEFRYGIIDNNCEHFASWCVTGTRLSVQIRKVTIVLKIFFKLGKGFRGLSDELLRNQVEYDHGMLCERCFERNKKMLSVPKLKVLKKTRYKKGT